MPSFRSIKFSYSSSPPPPALPPCHEEPSTPPPPPCSPCQHKNHSPPPPKGAAPPPPPAPQAPPPKTPPRASNYPPKHAPPRPSPLPLYPAAIAPTPYFRPSPDPQHSIAPFAPPHGNHRPLELGVSLGGLFFLSFLALAINHVFGKKMFLPGTGGGGGGGGGGGAPNVNDGVPTEQPRSASDPPSHEDKGDAVDKSMDSAPHAPPTQGPAEQRKLGQQDERNVVEEEAEDEQSEKKKKVKADMVIQKLKETTKLLQNLLDASNNPRRLPPPQTEDRGETSSGPYGGDEFDKEEEEEEENADDEDKPDDEAAEDNPDEEKSKEHDDNANKASSQSLSVGKRQPGHTPTYSARPTVDRNEKTEAESDRKMSEINPDEEYSGVETEDLAEDNRDEAESKLDGEALKIPRRLAAKKPRDAKAAGRGQILMKKKPAARRIKDVNKAAVLVDRQFQQHSAQQDAHPDVMEGDEDKSNDDALGMSVIATKNEEGSAPDGNGEGSWQFGDLEELDPLGMVANLGAGWLNNWSNAVEKLVENNCRLVYELQEKINERERREKARKHGSPTTQDQNSGVDEAASPIPHAVECETINDEDQDEEDNQNVPEQEQEMPPVNDATKEYKNIPGQEMKEKIPIKHKQLVKGNVRRKSTTQAEQAKGKMPGFANPQVGGEGEEDDEWNEEVEMMNDEEGEEEGYPAKTEQGIQMGVGDDSMMRLVEEKSPLSSLKGRDERNRPVPKNIKCDQLQQVKAERPAISSALNVAKNMAVDDEDISQVAREDDLDECSGEVETMNDEDEAEEDKQEMRSAEEMMPGENYEALGKGSDVAKNIKAAGQGVKAMSGTLKGNKGRKGTSQVEQAKGKMSDALNKAFDDKDMSQFVDPDENEEEYPREPEQEMWPAEEMNYESQNIKKQQMVGGDDSLMMLVEDKSPLSRDQLQETSSAVNVAAGVSGDERLLLQEYKNMDALRSMEEKINPKKGNKRAGAHKTQAAQGKSSALNLSGALVKMGVDEGNAAEEMPYESLLQQPIAMFEEQETKESEADEYENSQPIIPEKGNYGKKIAAVAGKPKGKGRSGALVRMAAHDNSLSQSTAGRTITSKRCAADFEEQIGEELQSDPAPLDFQTAEADADENEQDFEATEVDDDGDEQSATATENFSHSGA